MERLADKQDKANEKKRGMKVKAVSSKHMLTGGKAKVQRVKDDTKDKAASTDVQIKFD